MTWDGSCTFQVTSLGIGRGAVMGYSPFAVMPNKTELEPDHKDEVMAVLPTETAMLRFSFGYIATGGDVTLNST